MKVIQNFMLSIVTQYLNTNKRISIFPRFSLSGGRIPPFKIAHTLGGSFPLTLNIRIRMFFFQSRRGCVLLIHLSVTPNDESYRLIPSEKNHISCMTVDV